MVSYVRSLVRSLVSSLDTFALVLGEETLGSIPSLVLHVAIPSLVLLLCFSWDEGEGGGGGGAPGGPRGGVVLKPALSVMLVEVVVVVVVGAAVVVVDDDDVVDLCDDWILFLFFSR